MLKNIFSTFIIINSITSGMLYPNNSITKQNLNPINSQFPENKANREFFQKGKNLQFSETPKNSKIGENENLLKSTPTAESLFQPQNYIGENRDFLKEELEARTMARKVLGSGLMTKFYQIFSGIFCIFVFIVLI